MPARRHAAPRSVPATSERLPPVQRRSSRWRPLLLLGAGLLLAALAWGVRSSAWLHEQILRGKDLPTLEAIARRQPEDPVAQRYFGIRCYEARRFDAAQDAFEAAARASPQSAEIHYDLGLALYRMGHTKRALEEFERAGSLNDRLAEAEYMRGYLSGSLADPQTGLARIAHATELAPRNDKLWWGLARLDIQLNRQNDAIAALHKALSLREAVPEYHTALAEALILSGKPQEAPPHLERALQINPNFGEACALLGRFYLNHSPGADALDKAESLLQQATRYETLSPAQVHFDLGQVCAQKGQYREALAAFREAQREGYQRETLFYALANAARKTGDAKAAGDYEREFHRLSGLRLSIPAMQMRLRADPKNAEAHLTLARAYHYLEYKQQALNHYSAYLQIHPGNAAVSHEAGEYFNTLRVESARLLPESVLPDPL